MVKGDTPSYKEINEQYNLIENNIKLISLSEVKDKVDLFTNGGRAYFHEDILKSNIGKAVINRYLTKDSALQLEDAYENILDNSKSFKLLGHMNVGHYTDILTAEAGTNDYNIISVRQFFIALA